MECGSNSWMWFQSWIPYHPIPSLSGLLSKLWGPVLRGHIEHDQQLFINNYSTTYLLLHGWSFLFQWDMDKCFPSRSRVKLPLDRWAVVTLPRPQRHLLRWHRPPCQSRASQPSGVRMYLGAETLEDTLAPRSFEYLGGIWK